MKFCQSLSSCQEKICGHDSVEGLVGFYYFLCDGVSEVLAAWNPLNAFELSYVVSVPEGEDVYLEATFGGFYILGYDVKDSIAKYEGLESHG